jgi:uncharacterized protein
MTGPGRPGATADKTLTPVGDPLTAPFWEAARRRRLVIQRCRSCGELRWPPLAGCPECRSRDTTWDEVAPNGTVWSFVVYHRAFAAELKDEIPYTVVMVELDEGPHLVGRFVNVGRPPAIGDRVTAEFTEIDGVPSVRWRPADGKDAKDGEKNGKA